MKFDPVGGWPGFDKAIAGEKLTTEEDNMRGMHCVKINYARCGKKKVKGTGFIKVK